MPCNRTQFHRLISSTPTWGCTTLLFLLCSQYPRVFGQQWRLANGPYEGEVHKFAISTIQPSLVYAATTGGATRGLYRTSNAGTTWEDVGPDTSLGSILEPVVALSPEEPEVLY